MLFKKLTFVITILLLFNYNIINQEEIHKKWISQEEFLTIIRMYIYIYIYIYI